MVMGIDIAGMSALLVLASAAPQPQVCQVTKAPVINVVPTSNPIQYDFTRTKEQLTAMSAQGGGANPYGAGVDTVTGGLRYDRPRARLNVSWGGMSNPQMQTVCLHYDRIDVTFTLSPVIYIAKDFKSKLCRDTILEHEQKHVHVDRLVLNKYAMRIGKAVQTAVNNAGALGPFPVAEQARMEKQMFAHIESAINSEELLMNNEMNTLQSQVDSLSEYQRISAICREAEKNSVRN